MTLYFSFFLDIQGKQHGQTWSDPVERRDSPSWKEMLERCSSLVTPEEKSPNRVYEKSVSRSSMNETIELGGDSLPKHSTTLYESVSPGNKGYQCFISPNL